jgi:sensor histidine kinase YesM
MREMRLTFLRRAIDRLIYDLSLRYKLIVAFSFITLVPILFLGLFSSNVLRSNLQDSEMRALMQSLTQLNHSIDYYLGAYQNVSSLLFQNYELQSTLSQETNDLNDAIAARKNASRIVYQVLSSIQPQEIESTGNRPTDIIVRFYVENKKLSSYLGDIVPLEDIQAEPWFITTYQQSTAPVWQSHAVLLDTQYVVLNRKVVDFRTFQPLGMMRVFIPVLKIKSLISWNTPDNPYRYFYVDEQFTDIINAGVGPSDDMLRLIKAQGLTDNLSLLKAGEKEYIVGMARSSVTGWRLIFVAPTDVITAKTRTVSTITLISMLGSLVLCIIISVLFADFLTDRIDVLLKKTKRVDKDQFAIQQVIKGSDEIGQLDLHFNNMITRIDRLIKDEYKTKIVMNKVKLELLQEQINPHLLYNTLSLISMIAREDGRCDVVDVTDSLISFYKGILNRGKIITCLRDEIHMALTYIEIMRFVYHLNLDCTIEIDQAIYDCASIKLILQPVVENAILHGLRQNGGGQLFIGGIMRDSEIEFVVADDGVGMSEGMVNYLNSLRDLDDLEKGYGLANVIKRINLFWGWQYGVRVESSPGSGTTVRLRIPVLSEAEITQRLESKYLIGSG